MTEREQWRFQWPDGTWIRWNPQTQSWEKEDDSPREQEQAEEAAGEPAAATVIPTEIQEPAVPKGEPETAPAVEDPETESPAEEPRPQEEPAVELARLRRSRVDDVFPGRSEPERPGGSWWPTIIGAVIVGLAVGLVLSNIIR